MPKAQVAVGYLGLMPNYSLLPQVDIRFEGFENVPDRPVLYVMNHTDRYNYFPFQYLLWRRASRFTATWVKGKYYEKPSVATFMEWTNQLPTVSKGYIVTKDFVRTVGRRPTESEYELLRALVNRAALGETVEALPSGSIPSELTTTPREVLGRRFDPSRETYADCVNHLFSEMMRRFVELNEEAVAAGLDILVFPQGTRSIRLLPGHIGAAQMALHLRIPVVPVGCNGSDKVYPDNVPFARRGKVVYRFGAPIYYEQIPEFHVDDAFEPFSARAEAAHKGKLESFTANITSCINELLDPEYQMTGDRTSGGTQGTARFV
ncbi:MAG: 1-acyl-sn-glycerol-3-phosphate acyltransferase [Polyangiaceae bacterium]|nr:1-acyl-sn-glycerol-3-phosphate acyltransferase [Polyangiaceae bacterium]